MAQVRLRLSAPLPAPTRSPRETGKPGVKVGPGPSRGRPEPSLGPSLSLSPPLIGPRVQGFSCSLLAIGRGPAFFPLCLSLPPPSLRRPSDRSAPPAPSSSGKEEFRKKKFPRSLDQRKDGKTKRGRGRGRGERDRIKKDEVQPAQPVSACPGGWEARLGRSCSEREALWALVASGWGI